MKMQEIERKFLVNNTEYRKLAYAEKHIVQGFISRIPERTVRIRISDQKGFITIKGKSDAEGMSRFEWEKEIPVAEAEQLLNLCEEGIIQKKRYLVKQGNHTYEVDEFEGNYKGLIIAEVELNDTNECIEKPDWLAEEVTGDCRFYNSYLSNPKNSEDIHQIIKNQN